MSSAAGTHDWGASPELFGPRHDYREALVLRRLLPALPGPEVLNAGAGAGSLTLKMIDAGLRVTSTDASEELCEWTLAALRRRGADRDNPVIPGDLQTLELPVAAFDGAVCAEVLEHLDDDAAALARIAAALRPGGLLLVTVPADPFRYDWTDRWAGHRRRYAPEELHERIALAGFEDVRVDGWGFPLTGLYHRRVYRPALRRRLAAGGGRAVGGAPPRVASRVLRALLEVDSLFIGRRPGYHGLLATARRAGAA
ncbi:class I SAM-dependent methyltransferase [Miltoncostaea marina]|uniref:class I SAM-dependent methyltransferase n=1 Tax=Miltoncostaea marina TaxID=2843215 RepID=UPI001C3D31ED|nr:methyltransferase domain-containing protein [Miltoncostaea marina]